MCDKGLRGHLTFTSNTPATAVSAIFHEEVPRDPAALARARRELYARSQLLEPLGFNNTFTILVRGRDARERGLRTIEMPRPFAPSGRPASATSSCSARTGIRGWPRVRAAVQIAAARHGTVADLSRACRRQVDVIAGDATSGLIKRSTSRQLEDTRHYFPPV